MSKHLQKEIEDLRKRVFSLSSLVEKSVWQSVEALEERNVGLAEQVVNGDYEIDKMEIDVEEECLKILALHQPVATDLRYIISVLKMNTDLERIGDLAVNIAERAAFIASQGAIPIEFDFAGMAEKTQSMLKSAMDAVVNSDPELAHQVCSADDEVDEYNRQMYETVKQAITEHPEYVESMIHLLSVSRHLERIADLATNIAEDVIYMAQGEIVRHTVEDYRQPQEEQ